MADEEKATQATAEKAAEAKGAKTASIVTGTKILVVGEKKIRVPVSVDISKESDLAKELYLDGPTRPRFGPKSVKCYITIDGQRLTFDSKGNLI